jgi:hypothetical protein
MIRKLGAILCGIALTWAAAAVGLFFLTSRGCVGFVESKDHIAFRRVADIERALADYSLEHHRCPTKRDDLIDGGYIDAPSLVDPWGTSIASWCSHDAADVISAGPDRTFGTADDITSAR